MFKESGKKDKTDQCHTSSTLTKISHRDNFNPYKSFMSVFNIVINLKFKRSIYISNHIWKSLGKFGSQVLNPSNFFIFNKPSFFCRLRTRYKFQLSTELPKYRIFKKNNKTDD